MKLIQILLMPVLAVAIASCAKKEEILQGQRFDVRTPLSEAIPGEDTVAGVAEVVNRSVAIKLPKAQNTPSWTHRNGSAEHSITHPALASNLTRLWSASIGTGNDRKFRITSDPVIADGRIFTLDSQSTVTAFSAIGEIIWRRVLAPLSDSADEASGGGLAYSDGVVYVTTGFGELTALTAEAGSVVWQQRLEASVSAPPTVSGDVVYVVSNENKAWALNVKNGRIKWQQQSSASDASLVGGAAPAIAGRMVVLPFASGEMVAALTRNGLRVWSVAVSGSRRGQARSNIGDITGDPVVSGGTIYAANQSGRMISVDRRTGERNWTATEGSYSPVWPVGGSVFAVTDAARLVRLDNKDGSVIWAINLPDYEKEKTRKDAYAHFGPILAGGRLIVASSDGFMRSYDPVSGELVSVVEIPSGAASSPAIVDGVLYVLSRDGKLHAFK